jgi:hypothetical protein
MLSRLQASFAGWLSQYSNPQARRFHASAIVRLCVRGSTDFR